MEDMLKEEKSSKKETSGSAENNNSGESGDSREVENQLILENMDVDLGHFMTGTGDTDNVTSKESVEEVQCTVDVIEPPWMGREEEEVPNQVLPNHKSRSSGGHCQVDFMDHFDRVFEKKTFNSFKEFDELFSRFKKETGSVFRIKSSCSIAYENSRRKQHFIPPRFKFVSIKYCCVHYGQPKVSGQGIRTKQRYLPCGCGCVLSVAYNRGALFISQVNMRHNHEVSNKIAPYYAINRRITKHELKQVADVIAVMPSSRALQYFLKERFHRPMTLQDAKNTRARLKSMQIKQAQTESIKVIPAIKEFSPIHNETNSRAVLEIKEEREDANRNFDIDHEDSYQTKELPDAQQEEECEAAMKNKALSEMVAKISELMNSCDSSVFWERVDIMNKVMECWENGENLDVHYTSEYKSDDVDISSQEEKSSSLQRLDLQQNVRVLQDKVKVTDPNCNVAPQELADRHLKFLLPILNDSMQFVPTTVGGSVKLVLPQLESKVVKLNDALKRQRGRLRKKDSISSTLKELSGCVSYQKEPEVLDASQVKVSNSTFNSESRFTVDNESDCSDLYAGPPFISCITKEPCMDVSEQAMEVEIEINDSDIT